MKKVSSIFIFTILLILSSCNDGFTSGDDFLYAETSSSSDGGGSPNGGGQGNNSGLITAGEWNDLNNWNFWNDLLNNETYSNKSDYWRFYTNNRISVNVKQNNSPVINETVILKKNNITIWETKTDNFGNAELWIGLFQKESIIDLTDYKLLVNGQEVSSTLKLFEDGFVSLNLNISQNNVLNKVELAFIVDATGSMSDELHFLKDDLNDVIQRVKSANTSLDILTSTVFYRDIGDAYVVKQSSFTNNISETINFISQQSASGGGDFPEAVHTALNEGINNLQWSTNSKTRIAFLILDAPPHYDVQIIDDLHNLIKTASQKGIKLIPVTASGIDKDTEFLMRFFSIATNGTYVFITNDSGIGNDHLIASVGEYQVENLNDLMVRIITKYSN